MQNPDASRRGNALRRHSGARLFLGASPESIRPMVVMDSGPAPSGASRNDDGEACAKWRISE